MDIKNLKKQAQKELNLIVKIDELKEFERRYLGKEGKVTKLLRSLKNLPQKERRLIGKEANELWDKLVLAIKSKKEKNKSGLILPFLQRRLRKAIFIRLLR